MTGTAWCCTRLCEIEYDDGITQNVLGGHAIRDDGIYHDDGTTENSKPQPQVRACSGSLQCFYRAWLHSGNTIFEAVGHYDTSCGVKYVRNERGCTLDDIEDAPTDNDIVFPGLGIYARGCTRLLGYNSFERGCTRTSGVLSTSGFVVTEWHSENSIQGRIGLVCSGSLTQLWQDLKPSAWRFDQLSNIMFEDENAKKERGCTRIGDIYRPANTDDRYFRQWQANDAAEHTMIEPWILHALMYVQFIGHSYVMCLQFIMIIASRLLFLKFDRSIDAGASEAGWQILRGVFWASMTVSFIWTSRKPQPKHLVVVNGTRHSVCSRRQPLPSYKYFMWACMIINTHAIPAVKAFDAQLPLGATTEVASDIGIMDSHDIGSWLTTEELIFRHDVTEARRSFDGHGGHDLLSTRRSDFNRSGDGGDGWQSHVFDLWCIAGPNQHKPDQKTFLEESNLMDDEATSLMQLSVSVILVKMTQSSFTDEFLDLAWPLTSRGERDLAAAADTDPESLRLRWQVISARNGIPRPINVATYMLHRPPYARSPWSTFTLDTSSFDDPYLLPGTVEAHWPDLQMATWRLHQSHHSITTSRTWDDDVWHFILLNGREQSMFGFPTGIIEIVSRHNEDECSFAYGATIPAYATWAHLWSWLGIGNDFNEGTTYQIQVNGENIEDPMSQMSITHGFFVQITAMMPGADDPLTLPAERYRRLQGDLCFALPSGTGKVYRAGPSIRDTQLARLPYHERTGAILARWPHLSVWTMYKTHQTARGRSPPWAAMDDAVLIQENPDGMHVAVLCVVYDGSGPSEYALVVHRHVTPLTLYAILEIATRCLSQNFRCHTSVNLRPARQSDTLNLEEGDFVEVVIVSRDQRQIGTSAIHSLEDDCQGSTITTTTSVTFSTSIIGLVSQAARGSIAGTRCGDLGADWMHKPMKPGGSIWSSPDEGISFLQLRVSSPCAKPVAHARDQMPVRHPQILVDLNQCGAPCVCCFQSHVIDLWCTGSSRRSEDCRSMCPSETHHWPPLRTSTGKPAAKSPRNDETMLESSSLVAMNVQEGRKLCQAPLGGSYGGILPRPRLIGRSTSGNPPVWDVEAVFDRLKPPGNGPGQAMESIVDIRGSVDLDLLDDFVCNGSTVLIFELKPVMRKVPFTPPFTQQDALALLDPWHKDAFQTDFAGLDEMHPVGMAFIDAAGEYDPETLTSTDIFVDGSVQKTEEGEIASYAMVATGMHQRDDQVWYSMVGFSGGIVTIDETDISWLGAAGINALEAERCGVILAILWCLQAVDTWNVPITIYFDCMAAGLSAQGNWNVSIDSISSEIARSLGQAAQEFFGSRFTMSHIHGHSNAPHCKGHSKTAHTLCGQFA